MFKLSSSINYIFLLLSNVSFLVGDMSLFIIFALNHIFPVVIFILSLLTYISIQDSVHYNPISISFINNSPYPIQSSVPIS